jgi:coenzyme F420-0:L-glutamate ligase/coenzyme F420-1:gamma-L-glutamate ligase
MPEVEEGVRVLPVGGIGEVTPGADLAGLIAGAVAPARPGGPELQAGDVVVVTQKIVSKAEGKLVAVDHADPQAKLALVTQESVRVLRRRGDLVISETRHGFVCANAGVDQSNVPGDDVVSLLPRDPDRTAHRLAAALRKRTGKRIAVIVSDTFGRPWRLGLTNVAIGAAGVPALLDLRGTRDLHGKPLHATILAVADELAAAAGLAMDKAAGIPAAIVRGYRYRPALDPAANIIRPAKEDLFR